MASFPTSVKTFTTKNDGPGNNINAAHINDLQDEVNAIEAGYLNGTARLNAAGSTLASLSVTGNSTVAALNAGASTLASLQVSGNSSFATRPVFTPPDAALVFLESTGALGSSAASTFAFTNQAILTNSSVHSTATNPERLTPQSTGIYQFGLGVTLNAPSAASTLNISIRDSSNTVIAGRQLAVAVGSVTQFSISGIKRFDALGGYAVTQFSNQAGGSTFSASSGVGGTWFSLVKL